MDRLFEVLRSARSFLTRLARYAKGLRWVLVFAVVALFALVSEVLFYWQPPFSFLRTQGQIFVDSPEVYTRERLVNDRYEQDYWLRTQLNNLDRQDFFLDDQTRLSLGQQTESDSDATVPESAALGASNYQRSVAIKNDMRRDLRQQILENLLDDRHDLDGNSLYGFKFDTAILAGRNTRDGAFVRVRAGVEIGFPTVERLDGTLEKADINDFLMASFVSTHPLHSQFLNLEVLYSEWLALVEKRLNDKASENRILLANCRDQNRLQRAVQQIVGDALSLGNERNKIKLRSRHLSSVGPESGLIGAEDDPPIGQRYSINIDASWSEFTEIHLELDLTEDSKKDSARCVVAPQFGVSPIFDVRYLYLTEREDWVAPEWLESMGISTAFRSGNIIVGMPRSTESADGIRGGSFPIPQKLYADYIALADAEPMSDNGAVRKLCNLSLNVPLAECPDDQHFYPMVFSSGALRFIDALLGSESNSYVYAVTPHRRLSAMDTELSINGSVPLSEQGGAGALAAAWTSSGSRVSTQISGFSTGNTIPGQIEFGWAIQPKLGQTQFQSSQMVLLSIPQSVTEISFIVETGWLNPRGEVSHIEPAYTERLRMPPNPEAVEELVLGRVTLPNIGPRIEEPPYRDVEEVYVCSENRLLIRGERLWRSTRVTLGGFQASQIVIMPNMEGIVAVFDNLPANLALPESGAEAGASGKAVGKPMSLMVWTSEGVASSERAFLPVSTKALRESCI